MDKPMVWIVKLLPEFDPVSKFNVESPAIRTESRTGDIIYKDRVSLFSTTGRLPGGVKDPIARGCHESLFECFFLFLFTYISIKCLLFILSCGGVLRERCNSSLLLLKNESRSSIVLGSSTTSSVPNRSESSYFSGWSSEIMSTPIWSKYSRSP